MYRYQEVDLDLQAPEGVEGFAPLPATPEPELKSIFSLAEEEDFATTPRPSLPREAR